MAAAVSLLVDREPQRLLHPVPKTVQKWPGASLAYRAAMLGRLAANLFFDSVQCSDAQPSPRSSWAKHVPGGCHGTCAWRAPNLRQGKPWKGGSDVRQHGNLS